MEVIGRAKQDARAESNAGAVAEREACTPQGGIEKNPWGTETEKMSGADFPDRV